MKNFFSLNYNVQSENQHDVRFHTTIGNVKSFDENPIIT